ncbi:MAG: GNAT family N-acetyltransferase [Halopseudomonas aestusnigri]
MSNLSTPIYSESVMRLASPRDSDQIAKLYLESAREQGVESYVSQKISIRIRELITSQEVVFIVGGEQISAPISAVASIHFRQNVWKNSLIAQIEDVYVSPSERQQGYGRAIMTRALELIQSYGAEISSLAVNENNCNALNLYKALGFKNSHPSSWQGGQELALTLFHKI